MTDWTPARHAGSRLLMRLVVGVAGILLVAGAGLLIAAQKGAPFTIDAAWEREMTTGRTTAGVAVAMALAVAGGTLVSSLLSVALAVILFALRRWRTSIALIATLILASGASSLLKVLVARARPPGGLMRLSTYSYPSGHATTAAAIALVLVLALPRMWSWVLGACWVVAICWSRTYLGVHWLTDVAAGVVLGASVALLVTGVLGVLPFGDRPSVGGNERRRTASARGPRGA